MNARYKTVYRRSLTMGVTVAMTALLAIGLLFALTGPVLSQEAGTAPEGGYIYTVQEGDSWDIVALKTGVDVATLQEANPDAVRDTGWLLSGEQLAIPAVGDAESQTHVVGAGESWASIAEEYGVSVNLLFAANPDRVRPGLVLYQGEKLVIPRAVRSNRNAGSGRTGCRNAGAGRDRGSD